MGLRVESWCVLAYEDGVATIRRSFRPVPLDRESLAPLVVEHALDAVIVIDAAGCILDWNRRAEQCLGWAREQVLGRTLSETIIPPRYREAHERGLWVQRETGHGAVLERRVELEALTRAGGEIPIELSITALGSGRSARFIGFLRDLSAQRGIEEKNRSLMTELADTADRLRLALAAAGAGVWEWRADDRHVHGDARWAEIWGLPVRAEGWPVRELMARILPEDRTPVAPVDEGGRSLNVYRQRFRIQLGTEVVPLVNFASIQRAATGDVVRLVGVTQREADSVPS